MLDLAEASIEPVAPSRRLLRIAVVLAVVLLVAALAWWLKGLIGAPSAGPQRQVAKISILPDTPPPPPPPKEEKKPEPPKAEAKPQQQMDAPKPVQAPPVAQAPLKMEGAAGDGPSAFAAGSVSQEYKGGAPAVGASGPPRSGADRANERFYANAARQALRDELERQMSGEPGELSATLAVWIEADGRIQRLQLQPSDSPERDARVQAALDAVSRTVRLPPPPPVTQPLRFRLSLRAQG